MKMSVRSLIMRLLRKVGIPLAAILILLALLIAVIILKYEQEGMFLPFAVRPDIEGTETSACQQNTVEYIKENILIPNWRITK